MYSVDEIVFFNKTSNFRVDVAEKYKGKDFVGFLLSGSFPAFVRTSPESVFLTKILGGYNFTTNHHT